MLLVVEPPTSVWTFPWKCVRKFLNTTVLTQPMQGLSMDSERSVKIQVNVYDVVDPKLNDKVCTLLHDLYIIDLLAWVGSISFWACTEY